MSWLGLDALGRRAAPVYGQLSAWVILALGALYTARAEVLPQLGERVSHLSVVGYLLPEAVIFNPAVLWALKILFLLAAGAWALRRVLPWSPWAATLSFLVLISITQESNYYPHHETHAVTMLMVIYCAWFHLDRRAIAAASAAGRFWQTPLFPRWVFVLSLFYLGLTYSYSGLTKLWFNGPGWANGLSLQLWINYWGDNDALFSRLILSSVTLAMSAQIVTLLGEAGALLALLDRRLSVAFGLVLCGFHIGVEMAFHFGFYGNLVCIFMVMVAVPLLEMPGRLAEQARTYLARYAPQ